MRPSDANNRIEALLDQGLTTRDLLLIAAHHRRMEFEISLKELTGNTISGGIFKGVLHTGESYGSTLCPKLLGTYESEISKDLMLLCEEKDCFIEIGCAEGYYTTGVGVVTGINTIIGVDISQKALQLARESATLNNISGKCEFFSKLQAATALVKGNSLIMIDVDGSEIAVIRDLFGSMSDSQKQRATLIVETDFNADGSSNAGEINQLLEGYGFKVAKKIDQDAACRFSELTDHLSFLDRVIYGVEGRRVNQSWLIACPISRP